MLDNLNLADKPYRMPVINPRTGLVLKDKEGNEAYIELFGLMSDRGLQIKRKAFADSRRKRKTVEETYDQILDKAAETLAELTSGWYLVSLDGTPVDLPYSYDNAVNLYSEPRRDWLKQQVQDAVAEETNFM